MNTNKNLQLQTCADVQPERESAEGAYRRGYRDGYRNALFDVGTGRANRLLHFVYHKLTPWHFAYKEDNHRTPPPEAR